MSSATGGQGKGGRESFRPWPRSGMVYLLDVNVLIALLDPMHVQHERAHAWFADHVQSWASCALTQNGFLRIVSHPRYPNAVATPAEAAALLDALCARPDHQYWGEAPSLLDRVWVDGTHLLASGQVTDTWLLALAARRHACLATFDRRLVSSAVHGGADALHVIA